MVYDFCKKNHIQLQSWYPLGHGNSDMLKEAIFVELAKKYHKSTVQIILRMASPNGVWSCSGK